MKADEHKIATEMGSVTKKGKKSDWYQCQSHPQPQLLCGVYCARLIAQGRESDQNKIVNKPRPNFGD